ncbi:PPOX class F420-dependent oxidoreductase [Oryzobacter telluris]|uniref:PPOX class F420-dependent oxidoreductase n=1 Tax=Oryzobacter telluris TaxID=3149179 RepID=UPI00370D58EC
MDDTAGSRATPDRHPLADAKYAELTTYRRSGVGVATPVWIAADESDPSRLVVISVDRTGKVKRLAHTDRVELRPCSMRGQVEPGAPTYRGTGVVVRDAEGVAAVRRAVVAKYGLPARFANIAAAAGRLVGRDQAPRAGIVIDAERTPATPAA